MFLMGMSGDFLFPKAAFYKCDCRGSKLGKGNEVDHCIRYQ